MPSQVPTDTTAVVHPDTPEGRVRIRHRRIASWLTSLMLAAVIGGALLDGADVVDVWGVDTATIEEVGPGGDRLRVRYATVTRPALASPFVIEVVRPGGFDEQDVELAVDLHYLELWDLNGIYPSPAEERSNGDRVVWTFDPPDGDTLKISVDARIEPGAQLVRREGHVSLLDDDGAPIMTVRFTTSVRP